MSKHFANMKVFMLYPITAVDVSDQSDRALEGGVFSFNLIQYWMIRMIDVSGLFSLPCEACSVL